MWEVVWRFLTKVKLFSPYHLAVTLLGIYPKKLKIYVHIKTCTEMFIAALFEMPKVGSNQDVLP